MKTVIHQTDIYHEHLDPDDHWDLACQYALHYTGNINLAGVILDNVPRIRMGHGDPAVCAVEQIKYITGSFTATAIGTGNRRGKTDRNTFYTRQNEFAAVKMIKHILETASDQVIFQVVGSCKDMAVAIRLFGELFQAKCGAIYLNAGAGSKDSNTEYNVSLDPRAFQTVFEAPCAVFWLPSHENFREPYEIEKHGTFYRFRQKDILEDLPDQIQKYFIYALGKVMDPNWLSYLSRPKDTKILHSIGEEYRNMWSTAGILAAAGKAVSYDGKIICAGEPEGRKVFSFRKIKGNCDAFGHVTWEYTSKSSSQYIFEINDVEQYQGAMIKAMKELLLLLPPN